MCRQRMWFGLTKRDPETSKIPLLLQIREPITDQQILEYPLSLFSFIDWNWDANVTTSNCTKLLISIFPLKLEVYWQYWDIFHSTYHPRCLLLWQRANKQWKDLWIRRDLDWHWVNVSPNCFLSSYMYINLDQSYIYLLFINRNKKKSLHCHMIASEKWKCILSKW